MLLCMCMYPLLFCDIYTTHPTKTKSMSFSPITPTSPALLHAPSFTLLPPDNVSRLIFSPTGPRLWLPCQCLFHLNKHSQCRHHLRFRLQSSTCPRICCRPLLILTLCLIIYQHLCTHCPVIPLMTLCSSPVLLSSPLHCHAKVSPLLPVLLKVLLNVPVPPHSMPPQSQSHTRRPRL